MNQNSRPAVVVIGGGYAGAIAANRLLSRPGVAVTLVNPRPRFVERIRLHQHSAGSALASHEWRGMVGNGVRLVVDRATLINSVDRCVELASGDTVGYDHLVYAVGSTGTVPTDVPGAAEFAHHPAEFEGAQRLRATLANVGSNAPVVVVGGGLTGIETAAELAEQGRAVTLVCGGALAPALSARGRRSVSRGLRTLGVVVRAADRVREVRADAVVLGDATVLPAAVTVWTAGFGVPDLAARSGLRTDSLGRLITDETLTSMDDDRIVAAGDCAAPSGHALRMSCQAAVPMGAHAADTVLHHLAGTPATPIDQIFTGSCISLGRRRATVQPARRDDRPLAFALGGPPAVVIKELICRLTVRTVRTEATRPGSTWWPRGGAAGRASSVADT